MFSKILIRLIDQAILPAIVLLCTRVISIIAISKYLGYTFSIGSGGFVFDTKENYLRINSYSLMAMVGVLSLGFCYILFKSYVFHDTHIKPGLSARLFSLKISNLIQNTYEIYSQGVIWISYIYLLLMVSFILAVFSFVDSWVFYVALGLAVVQTAIFVLDIEREVEISRANGTQFDPDISYMEQEDFVQV